MLLSHILKYTIWTPSKLLNILNGPNPHECPAASCPAISGPVWCLNLRPIRFALFHFSSSAKSQFKIKLFHKLEFHDFVRFKNAAKIIKSALNNAPIRLTFYRHQVGINLKTRLIIFGPCCSNLWLILELNCKNWKCHFISRKIRTLHNRVLRVHFQSAVNSFGSNLEYYVITYLSQKSDIVTDDQVRKNIWITILIIDSSKPLKFQRTYTTLRVPNSEQTRTRTCGSLIRTYSIM